MEDINDDVDLEEDIVDYKSTDFILQNLNIPKYYDKTDISQSREKVIETICDQMLFFVMCILKGYLKSVKSPKIYIFGAGYVGSCIIEVLRLHGCGPLLRIFVRNENSIQQWRNKGLKAVSKIKRSAVIDLIIVSSNLASFSALCKTFQTLVGPHTAVLTCTFGLQRRRIFHILNTPCVLRCFVEPQLKIDDNSNKGPFRGDFASLSSKELSARLLAGGVESVQNLILILENYYVIRGYAENNARAEAIDSVLGREDPLDLVPSRQGIGMMDLSDFAAEQIISTMKPSARSQILEIVGNIYDSIGRIFQVELSKHILVVDIPRIRPSTRSGAGGSRPMSSAPNSRPMSARSDLSRPATPGQLYKRPLSSNRKDCLIDIEAASKYCNSALSDASLVDIFKKDSKSNNLNDMSRIEFLQMEAESDSDGGGDACKNELLEEQSTDMDDVSSHPDIMRLKIKYSG